ncbi:ankyrin repeat domain-containing protein 40-like isoform X2 [Leptopilina boulardi]|uniref:ankyrin repeat domain-containing protein 40-like isoform X2 n=1 Tax=Leptopilina boulardi TaxID=63433 RepID=UPI0021F68F04|nr:ankyrin repeat domain-containing protein 40-like isoform X2 [Leptopilina boulardi]
MGKETIYSSAHCNLGDVNRVEELLNFGVNVNSRHPKNGRTALIFACQMNRQDVIMKLLENGADQNITSDSGESPKSVCTNPQILQILSDGEILKIAKLTTALGTSQSDDYAKNSISSKEENLPDDSIPSNELVLKVRLANIQDDVDFIEIDLPKTCLTFQALLHVCCQELNIDESRVVKLRKLPNTKIRRDKDVERLENFQEIEVVTDLTLNVVHSQDSNGAAMPLTPSNNYQSISKKDQTILY